MRKKSGSLEGKKVDERMEKAEQKLDTKKDLVTKQAKQVHGISKDLDQVQDTPKDLDTELADQCQYTRKDLADQGQNTPKDLDTKQADQDQDTPKDLDTKLADQDQDTPKDLDAKLADQDQDTPKDLDTKLADQDQDTPKDLDTKLADQDQNTPKDLDTKLADQDQDTPKDLDTKLADQDTPKDLNTKQAKQEQNTANSFDSKQAQDAGKGLNIEKADKDQETSKDLGHKHHTAEDRDECESRNVNVQNGDGEEGQKVMENVDSNAGEANDANTVRIIDKDESNDDQQVGVIGDNPAENADDSPAEICDNRLADPQKNSERDEGDFEETSIEEEEDESGKDNLLFYQNELCSRPSPGSTIEDMLAWKGNYDCLERGHSYIQWLFPIPDSSGLNQQAQPLNDHEAEAIRGSLETKERVLRAYEMMLDFYGLRLVNKDTGQVQRNEDNWSERFKHLNTFRHNHMRITRIIASIGELGYEQYQGKLVEFLMQEAVVSKTLPNINGDSLNYFIDAITDQKVRYRLYNRLHEMRSQEIALIKRGDGEMTDAKANETKKNVESGLNDTAEIGNSATNKETDIETMSERKESESGNGLKNSANEDLGDTAAVDKTDGNMNSDENVAIPTHL